MLTYKEESIQNAVTLLNNIETKGVDNAKRIALIAQILVNPEEDKGEKDVIRSKDTEV